MTTERASWSLVVCDDRGEIVREIPWTDAIDEAAERMHDYVHKAEPVSILRRPLWDLLAREAIQALATGEREAP